LIELLLQLPTTSLLPLTLLSRRFHDIILRILHDRLVRATALEDHCLVFECFHPSTKFLTPYLYCEHLSTDSLADNIYWGPKNTGNLGKMTGLYAHFRPLPPDPERFLRRPHPAGGAPAQPSPSTWYQLSSQESGEPTDRLVSTTVSLDSHEWFTQLCTVTSLVKVGPRHGVFKSCVKVGEGVVRIWRDWLASQAFCRPQCVDKLTTNDSNTAVVAAPQSADEEKWKERMLWLDRHENIGLKMKVRGTYQPNFVQSQEDIAVSYFVEYEGEIYFWFPISFYCKFPQATLQYLSASHAWN
jgi:hypothetical protein